MPRLLRAMNSSLENLRPACRLCRLQGRIVLCITFVNLIVIFEHMTTTRLLTMRPICLSFSSVDTLERTGHNIPILSPRPASLQLYPGRGLPFSRVWVGIPIQLGPIGGYVAAYG